MAVSTVEQLFTNFEEYVPKHIISVTPCRDELNITYEYIIYDLVDKDLDFDELYYDKLIQNFQRILFEECKSIAKLNPAVNIKILVSKKLMQGESKTEVLHKINANVVDSKYYL